MSDSGKILNVNEKYSKTSSLPKSGNLMLLTRRVVKCAKIKVADSTCMILLAINMFLVLLTNLRHFWEKDPLNRLS